MSEPASHLHVAHVNEETGERLEDCPACVEKQHTIDVMNRKLNGMAAEIGRLLDQSEERARSHHLWSVAERLFHIWQEATGRTKTKFSPAAKPTERFELVRAWLKDKSTGPTEKDGPPRNDFERCAAAIIGRACEHYTVRRANGTLHRFHEWERIFGKRLDFDESLARRPRDWRERMARFDPGPLKTGPQTLDIE